MDASTATQLWEGLSVSKLLAILSAPLLNSGTPLRAQFSGLVAKTILIFVF